MDERAPDPFGGLDTVGVVAANGPDYVRALLDDLAGGRVSVPLGAAADRARLEATSTREVIVPEEGSGWLGIAFASAGGDAPAQISFTSGTEGAPKAVLLSRTNLHDVVTRLIAVMEIGPEIREYIGVPVHHSFGYARARTVLHAGGDGFVPAAGFDLAEIRRMLRAGEINAVSAVPSLWRVFLDNLDMFADELESVRWVEIGSQYMSGAEKAALRAALPNARIVQHYGLTEASRTSLLRIHAEPEAALDSVGRAEGAVDIRISAAGRIETRGPHVALGILEGGVLRRLGPGAWLETGDLGRIEDGLLHYEGRADDMINCAGIKLSPDLIEAELRRAVPDAGDFGLLGTRDALRGEGLLLAVTPGAAGRTDALVDALCEHAAGLGLAARDAVRVRRVAELPRTATGKLRRGELAQALARTSRETPETPAPAQAQGVAALLRRIFGARLTPQASFNDLGGDSLSHMQLCLALERAFGTLPEQWEAMALGPLAERADAAGEARALTAGGGGAPPLPDGSTNMNPADIGFLALIAEDFRTNEASIFHQGFLMLLIHRFGNLRMGIRWKLLRILPSLLYRILNKLAQLLFGMKLDHTVRVGRRVKLEHFGGMILGARAIGNDVWIRQNTTFGIRSLEDTRAKPVIGDFVDIGAGAVIVGNITIGENSVIGANTVVFSNVPPDSVVIGVPGRIVGRNPRRNPSPLGPRG